MPNIDHHLVRTPDEAWEAYRRNVAPDSRMIRSLREKKDALGRNWQEIYCANCGKLGGMITKEWACYMMHLCDDCVWQHGPPPMSPFTEDDLAAMQRGDPVPDDLKRLVEAAAEAEAKGTL